MNGNQCNSSFYAYLYVARELTEWVNTENTYLPVGIQRKSSALLYHPLPRNQEGHTPYRPFRKICYNTYYIMASTTRPFHALVAILFPLLILLLSPFIISKSHAYPIITDVGKSENKVSVYFFILHIRYDKLLVL